MSRIGFIICTFLLLWTDAISQLPNYVPTSELSAWYSFNGNILDNSGNGHNNANYNIVSTTDRFNSLMSALYFSGSGAEYLNYGDVDDFEPYKLSLSFWINPEDHGGSTDQQVKPVISKWSAPNDLVNSTYNVFMDGSDLCFVLTDAVTTDTVKASLVNVPLNLWSHVVITANYGFIKIYINNALITDTSSAISSFNNTTSDFKVGGWYQDVNSSFSSFTGKIDDLGLWSRELSSCEVEALYTGNSCATSDVDVLSIESKSVIRITDLIGREVEDQPNRVLIYHYSNGTSEKIFRLE